MTRLAVVLCAGVLPALALAQDKPAAKPATGFVDKTFKNADGTTSPYVVFVPRDYDGKKEYPVILFLHGAGETKSNKSKGGKMPVEVGIGPAIKKREKDFPFVVVIPRAEGFGWQADGPVRPPRPHPGRRRRHLGGPARAARREAVRRRGVGLGEAPDPDPRRAAEDGRVTAPFPPPPRGDAPASLIG